MAGVPCALMEGTLTGMVGAGKYANVQILIVIIVQISIHWKGRRCILKVGITEKTSSIGDGYKMVPRTANQKETSNVDKRRVCKTHVQIILLK